MKTLFLCIVALALTVASLSFAYDHHEAEKRKVVHEAQYQQCIWISDQAPVKDPNDYKACELLK